MLQAGERALQIPIRARTRRRVREASKAPKPRRDADFGGFDEWGEEPRNASRTGHASCSGAVGRENFETAMASTTICAGEAPQDVPECRCRVSRLASTGIAEPYPAAPAFQGRRLEDHPVGHRWVASLRAGVRWPDSRRGPRR
jgi:hypothetical protein